MAKVELVMPKMGESIIEATILKWCKKVGDRVEQDETILEIATDKVDSEVPSPVSGVIAELFFEENAVVAVGKVIGFITTEASVEDKSTPSVPTPKMEVVTASKAQNGIAKTALPTQSGVSLAQKTESFASAIVETDVSTDLPKTGENGRFYSPLVRTIAKQEGVSVLELEAIAGSGEGGRVTKTDILTFVDNKKTVGTPIVLPPSDSPMNSAVNAVQTTVSQTSTSISGNVEIIEMDRMRQVIAKHMTDSLLTSAHVTSFVEADVTNIVNWRNRIKGEFQKKYGENITFTPIFIEAVCRALRDFPLVNSSVKGTQIFIKKDLNIGMAAALPSGNLIVPVIKNADSLNLVGLSKAVNDLANRARNNKLKPEDTQGGTFTLTNVGGFGNVMGTPIINQPQVAIMATGAIKKKPAVLETEFGDVIAVRHLMFLSLSYDHRIVDGALGGSFLRRVADYLEQFDVKRGI
ncbi:MAG: dihydrolipoamide acetyltransferase family protein [Saprospiraceae bacterium]|nr:dihydrolipoamide acetyltransferase family protein [Saprospiraceae bacterium]